MAKRSGKPIDVLHGSTVIEVVAVDENGKPYKKEMTIDQADEMKKVKGFKYIRFQLGFSQFKTY